MTDRRRILLVEDNEVDRLVVTAFLARLGFAAEAAGDGDTALARLATGRYDAVLLDCRLPGRDGLEVAAELRRREGTGPRTPVIALSAAAGAEAEGCRAAGMDEVLAKPVTLGALQVVLGRWCGAGGTTAGPTTPDEPRAATRRTLDPDRLAELRSYDPDHPDELIADLARSFLTRAADMLDRLAAAVRAGDAGTAAFDAHALKGSAANLGAAHLAGLAAELELVARRGELGDARALLRGLEDEFGAVRRELAAHVRDA
jgi:CheY-like chemotaxis protein